MTIASPAHTSNHDQPTFRVGVDGIRIDVLVSAGGRPIADLTARDFEVRDNGVVQTVAVTPPADLSLRVVLALDTSRSVGGDRLDDLQAAARALTSGLQQGDEAGLITFDGDVVERVPVSRSFGRLNEALALSTATGDTALVDAVLASMLLAEDDASRSVAIVFSDGQDTASFMSPEEALAVARATNSVVYGVWSGEGRRPGFLRQITEASGGRLIELRNRSSAASTLAAILDELRRRYLITYTPTGVAKAGWHRIDVRVKRRGATVQARPGYFGGSL